MPNLWSVLQEHYTFFLFLLAMYSYHQPILCHSLDPARLESPTAMNGWLLLPHRHVSEDSIPQQTPADSTGQIESYHSISVACYWVRPYECRTVRYAGCTPVSMPALKRRCDSTETRQTAMRTCHLSLAYLCANKDVAIDEHAEIFFGLVLSRQAPVVCHTDT